MLSCTKLDRIAHSIRSASASIETRFLDMGNRLGTAVDTIGTLTQTFNRLADELKSENLRDATNALSQIMLRVTALAGVHDDKRPTFRQLADLTCRVQGRVAQMGKAVTDIGMLATNARIEAANIGDAGLDFAIFTTEIGRTLGLAHTSLDLFTGELSGVTNHLHLAAASQLALAQQQATAIRSIPVRLAESIGAITDRGTRAVAAASAVVQKSRRVGQSISDAVMALQIGDITHQRLEHIDYVVNIIAEILAPTDEAEANKHGEWSMLTSLRRHALAVLCARLLSAQLLDAADEFDREVRQILSSVQALAADAEDLLRLGNATVGAADDRRGTFLGKVEEQVVAVEALLKGVTTARREANTVAVSVSEATGRLVSHASNLRSLEEDIRIMGLNTSLKCGRLGMVGRPLMAISQELRVYSNRIGTEASQVTVHLEDMVTTAGSLSGGEQEERAADIATVAAIMADSVSRLAAAGESLADSLDRLAHDTKGVASILRDTVARAAVHEELAKVLRQAAADLMSATADSEGEDEIATPEADHTLGLITRSYTMERERVVHDRHVGGGTTAMASIAPSAVTPAAGPIELEDIFF
jgi:hypothetical protein